MTSDEQIFAKAVAENISIAGVLRALDRAYTGLSYKFVRDEAARLGLETGHWKGQSHGSSPRPTKIPWANILVNDSSCRIYPSMKVRMIDDGLLVNNCAICGMAPEWNGKPLILRLDHVSGSRRDNRLENLRLICPNCDSQTDTFCGRNTKHVSVKKTCEKCGKPISQKSSTCNKCKEPGPTKILWPTTEELKARVTATSFLAVARELGVSDNAIRKRLRNHDDVL
jgi:hypothetical protein